MKHKLKLTQTKLTLYFSAFFLLFYNFTFFKKTLAVYPLQSGNILFLASIAIVIFFAINLFLSILRIRAIYKGFLFAIFFLAAMAAYVMDSYGTVIDETMLLNISNTDSHEALDLLNFKLVLYLLFLFIIPSTILHKVEIEKLSFKTEIFSRLKSIFTSLFVILAMVLSFSKFYATFLREQKPLRYYTNPTYWIYSMGKFGSSFVSVKNKKLQELGRNSFIPKTNTNRGLVIMVVGETARKDRFSINGHAKKTNPFLEKEAAAKSLVSFTNVSSCGTSTAISVPCMFSHLGREKFDVDNAAYVENLLDVLSHTKDVNVLWRDNNSNSKGVANRVKYEDFKSAPTNTICSPECRDVGMLVGLQKYIDSSKEKNVFIVLHQMGNHGPAYFKRYPPEFEIFKPACKTSELSECTSEEITNAYDNAILYTDFFLSKVIELLKTNSKSFDTAMMYVSDHGESLGENGIYLHGLPYMMAPKEQREVPFIIWLGPEMQKKIDYVSLKKNLNEPYSHDNIFHTVLGFMKVNSTTYNDKMDMLQRFRAKFQH